MFAFCISRRDIHKIFCTLEFICRCKLRHTNKLVKLLFCFQFSSCFRIIDLSNTPKRMQISECPGPPIQQYFNEYDEGNLFQFLTCVDAGSYSTPHMNNNERKSTVFVFVCILSEILYEALQTFLWFVHLILNDVYLGEKKNNSQKTIAVRYKIEPLVLCFRFIELFYEFSIF